MNTMTTTATARRPRPAGGITIETASLREVRLVGRPPRDWEPGATVDLAGRAYRVVDDSPSYAHLRAEAG